MIGNKCLLALAAVLACSPIVTHADETIYTFDSVTSVEHTASNVLITGILVNDTVPTTVTLVWTTGPRFDRCERLFNVVLSEPSAFTLTVVNELVIVIPPMDGPPIPTIVFNRCRAERKS